MTVQSDEAVLEYPRTHGGVRSALPEGIRIERGLGGRCWDQYGGEYVDLISGYGGVLLGHGHSDVNRAIVERITCGILFATRSALQEEVAAQLQSAFGGEACQFFKTGSECVTAAVRLARAFTKKQTVIRCGFHGWHEEFIRDCRAWHQFEESEPFSGEVTGLADISIPERTLSWNGVDIGQLEELLRKRGSEVAAILLDPVQLRPPFGDNFRAIRALATQYNALLILDEIKTALRVHRGGVQGHLGVAADITLVGKSMANGLPLAAIISSHCILRHIAKARIMGTFNGELCAIAAARATLKIMNLPESVDTLWAHGERFIATANAIFRSNGLEERIIAVPYRWPSMPYVWFRDRSLRRWQEAFYRDLARCSPSRPGILLLANHMNFICLTHTDHDIQQATAALDETVERFKARFHCTSSRSTQQESQL